MNNILVSVIIPVYNVAQYVKQCLQSVLDQSYDNIEIIVIDDCGTDDSIAIVESIKEKYQGEKTIKILHHDHNRGLSAARNTGIKEAKGEWVYFLDSDDWISPDCIEILVKTATQTDGIEMAVADYEASDGMRVPGNMLLDDGVYTKDIYKFFINEQFYTPVWNKLVKKEFIISRSLLFEEGLIHEDNLWSFCSACVMKKLAIINKVTYYYLIRSNSLAHIEDRKLHFEHYLKCAVLQAEFLKKNGLSRNRLLYDYVLSKWHYYYHGVRLSCSISFIVEMYNWMKQSKSWTLFDLLYLRVHWMVVLRSFHKYIPGKYSFIYYIKMLDRYGKYN